MSFKIISEFPIAYNSNDHKDPKGAIYDNSKNYRFNEKIYSYFKDYQDIIRKNIKVLDLGCAGGGSVRDFLEGGCTAIGIDGSDASLNLRRVEWAALVNHYLFTADITKEFQIVDGSNKNCKFDLITSWEVIEHLKLDGINTLLSNVNNHLKETGLLIVSIDISDGESESGLKLHQTIRSKDYWVDLFEKHNLVERPEFYNYFNNHYIRSVKFSAPNSFVGVFTKNYSTPSPKKLKFKTKIMDYWFGSRIQKIIKRFILGPNPYDKKI